MKILRIFLLASFLSTPCYSAVDFNGTTSKLTFAVDDSFFRENQAVTASAWIYPRSAGGGNLAFIMGRSTGGETRFKIDNNGLGRTIGFVVVGVTTLNRQSFSNSINFNQWQHVLMTWDGGLLASGVHLYINGIESPTYQGDTNSVTPTDNSTAPFSIGANSGTTRTFDGYISDVAVWDSVLPNSEIVKLATPVRGMPLQCSVTPKRYYPLDNFLDNAAIPTTAGLVTNRQNGVNDNGTQSGGAIGRADHLSCR